MKRQEQELEPMCETSENGEWLIRREEMLAMSLKIGRRVMEVFGYQRISNIVFRLKSTSYEINAVVNGEKLPSAELLLGIHRATGASIDWLLTGNGARFIPVLQISDLSYEKLPSALWFNNHENERELPSQ